MTARPTSAATVSQNSGSVAPEIGSVGLLYVAGRHKWLILTPIFTFLCVGAFYTSRQVAMFQSSSRLLIEPAAKADLPASSAVADSYILAQVQLLTSASVLDQAASALQEINLKSLAGSTDIAGTVRDKIKVDLEKEDGVITVAYATPVATDSAAIVNAVVDAYRTYHLQEENQTDHDTLHFLQIEKDKHDQEVARATTALANFKIAHPDFTFEDVHGTNIVYLKLTKLSDELTDAQSNSLEMNAKYTAVAAKLPPLPDGTAVVASDDSDVDASWVQSELNRINANVDDLTARGVGPTDANLIEARASQARLRQKLAVCQRNASLIHLNEIKTELDFANRREAELQKAVDDQKAAATALNAETTESAHLIDDVKQAQKASEEVDARLKTVAVTTDLPPEVRVLEPARPAAGSTGPGYRIMGFAGAAGLLAGMGLSYGVEVLDTTLRSPEEASGILGLPVLGVIPQQRGKPSVDILGLVSHTDPMSGLSDGVRRVRAAIFAASRSTPAKTILVTSPVENDGKSIFASNLAIVMAQSGGRTLLIDANFRSPNIQNIFDLQRSAGLADVISGKLAADRAIRRTPVEGLEVMSCGTILRNPSEMLNGTAFARLIKQLSEKYQCILLDSPPVLSFPDARILGASADLTLMVVRTGSTKRKSADQGLDQLLSVGSRVLGVVVNDYSMGRPTPRLRGALRSLEVLAEDTTFESHNMASAGAPGSGAAIDGDKVIIAAGNKKMKSNVSQNVDVFD